MLSRGKFNFIGYSTGFVVITGTYNTPVGYRTGGELTVGLQG